MTRLVAPLLAASLLLLAPVVQAQAPDSLAHQGLLTDPAGAPVPDGDYAITFALYTAPTGGSPLWTEARSVTTEGGLYAVTLGAVTPLADVAFDRPLWLGVRVEADPEMSPRTPLVAAPYALGLRALRVAPETAGDGPNMIGGWSGNTVSPTRVGATIAGGGDPLALGVARPNAVTDDYGSVGGGFGNTAGPRATVGGGARNTASGDGAVIGGGADNAVTATDATVGGGSANAASGLRSVVAGGRENEARDFAASVGGGFDNTASGSHATVAGGDRSRASGAAATVPGGQQNEARGSHSLAAGYRARAAHEGAFVWSDRSVVGGADSLVSTAANQFLIRAAGGVGIGTAAPTSPLTVAGVVESTA
ncbi:MAG: hypothetical protein R3181_05865, partial [Rubricoccaceae bacterium]|nr:hypothetical protein [Rubricoccaceae bacterium]